MKTKKIIIISILLICMFCGFASIQHVYASSNTASTRTSITRGSSVLSNEIWGDALAFANAGNLIVGIIRWVGIAVIIGAMIVKGIKFVSVSPEGKAEIKKELIMLAIGAVIIFALTTILGIIINIVQRSGLH